MATAAERLRDALIKHQITLERLRVGTARKLVSLLRNADAGMVSLLRDALSNYGEFGSAAAARKSKSLKNLIARVLATRAPVWTEVRQATNAELFDFARVENEVQAEKLERSIGLEEVTVAALSAAAVQDVFRRTRIRGARVHDALRDIEDREWSTIKNAITLAVVENTPVEDFVKALRGSREAGYKDGQLQQARQQLGTTVATGINSVSTNIRDAVWRESGIVVGEKWVSVLDGRTTLICQANDGHGAPFDGREDEWPDSIPLLDPIDQRPPAHYNCRSYMEAVLATTDVVKSHRMSVTSTIPDEQKSVHFRSAAREAAGDRWSDMSERQRREAIRDEQRAWAEENIGKEAPRITYPQWLGEQPAAFQDDVLGATRGALFRRGGLEVDSFVDFNGKAITLDLLRSEHPNAFKRAGL